MLSSILGASSAQEFSLHSPPEKSREEKNYSNILWSADRSYASPITLKPVHVHVEMIGAVRRKVGELFQRVESLVESRISKTAKTMKPSQAHHHHHRTITEGDQPSFPQAISVIAVFGRPFRCFNRVKSTFNRVEFPDSADESDNIADSGSSFGNPSSITVLYCTVF